MGYPSLSDLLKPAAGGLVLRQRRRQTRDILARTSPACSAAGDANRTCNRALVVDGAHGQPSVEIFKRSVGGPATARPLACCGIDVLRPLLPRTPSRRRRLGSGDAAGGLLLEAPRPVGLGLG